MLYYTLTSSLMFLELSNVNNTYKLYSYPTASKIANNTPQCGIIFKTKITGNNLQRTVFSVSLVES